MKEPDELVIDLEELEEDRRRNEEDRRRMLDAYAKWLKDRGVIQAAPKRASAPTRRRSRGSRRPK